MISLERVGLSISSSCSCADVSAKAVTSEEQRTVAKPGSECSRCSAPIVLLDSPVPSVSLKWARPSSVKRIRSTVPRVTTYISCCGSSWSIRMAPCVRSTRRMRVAMICRFISLHCENMVEVERPTIASSLDAMLIVRDMRFLAGLLGLSGNIAGSCAEPTGVSRRTSELSPAGFVPSRLLVGRLTKTSSVPRCSRTAPAAVSSASSCAVCPARSAIVPAAIGNRCGSCAEPVGFFRAIGASVVAVGALTGASVGDILQTGDLLGRQRELLQRQHQGSAAHCVV